MAELIYPDASSWINALEAGQKAGMTDRRNAAASSAGGLMASGDYKGAAGALYGAGDFQNGAAIAKAGIDQKQAGDKLARQTAVQGALAKGDFASAYAAAGTDSDLLEGLGKVAEHAKETTSTMASALQALKGPDGQWLPQDQARAKYAAMKPGLLQRGLDPKQLDGFDPTPDNLQAIESQVLGLDKQLALHKPVTVGHDLVDPVTGKPVYQGTDWKSVGEGDKLVPVTGGRPGMGGEPAPTAGPTQAAAPDAPQADAPHPTGGIYAQVGQIASSKGAQPQEVGYLQRLAQVESHGDPSATNGRSTGLFQFHPDTFAAVGGHNINDVGDQTAAALELSRRDRGNLQQLGLEPTDANVYLMHQQGAAGGRALLTAPPEVNAVQALTPVYGSAKIAQRAIVGNGGTPDMTAGDFVGMWRQRWGNGGKPVATSQSAAAPPAPGMNDKGDPVGTIYGSEKPSETGGLTPDARHLMAARYLKDGTLPPLGMGKSAAADRQAILNEAATIAKSLGVDANDLVAGTLSVKAAGQALNKATTVRAQVEGFEQTAMKNADLMLSLAPKGGGQTNAPVLNRWLQAGRKQIAGDVDVANFDIALGTFADEYAKIVSGATGSQGSTDASRKEAYDRLSKYATQGQLQGGIATMKQEMANRVSSMHDVEDGLRAQIRGGGQPGANGGTPPAAQPTAATLPGATPQQNAYIAKMHGQPRGNPGEQSNPFFPVSAKQFEGLKAGAWFVNPADGQLLQKTH